MGEYIGNPTCCCGGDCFIMSDTFVGGASTNVGSEWNEESGNWALNGSGQMTVSGVGLIVTTAFNKNSKRGVFDVVFTATGEGPWELNLLLSADADGSNAKTVSASFSATTCTLTANLITKTFTTATTPVGKPSAWIWHGVSSKTFTMRVCHTGGLLFVSLSDDSSPDPFFGCLWDIDETLAPGTNGHAGIQSVSGAFAFDSAGYVGHLHDTIDSDPEDPLICEDCTCTCGEYGDEDFGYAPFRIQLDFFNPSGPCVAIDGDQLLFEAVNCELEQTGNDFWFCVSGSVLGNDGWGWAIDCDSLWTFTGDICDLVFTDVSQVTCDPFELRYDWSFIDIQTECTDCPWTGPADDTDSFWAIGIDGS